MKNKLITIGCFVGIVLIISLMVFLKLGRNVFSEC